MQTRAGDNPDRWNVFYRRSADGGGTWSSPVKISDAPAGATAYHHAAGFDEIYGDYGEIAVTNTGKTFATRAKDSVGPGPAAPGSTFNSKASS